MPARLLIVALDAAEPLLVEKWGAMGKLPTLTEIRQHNYEVALENFPGFGNGVFWPSLNTGTDPSHHGRYYRSQVVPPNYTVEPFLEDRDMKVPPFWRALEDKGYQLAIIDPVETGMGFLSKGIELVRWMVHGRTGPAESSPAHIVSQFINRFGDDPFDGNADAARKAGLSLEEMTEQVLRRIDTKTRAMRELLDERDWDVFYVTYGDPHDVGHLAWHVHEEQEQSKDPDATLKNPLARCYKALDASVAELMKSVTEEGQTIVLMGPGMEANVSGNLLLAEILRSIQGRPRRAAMNPLVKFSRFLAQSPLVPTSIRKKTKRAKARARSKVRAATGQRFYSIPHNENAGAIRLSVVGREPNGMVLPGKPYDEACVEISEQLLAIKDASGTVPIISRIVKVHDEYSGPALEALPDLMIIWNREADLSRVSSPQIGTINNPTSTGRSGDHSNRGLLLSDQPISAAGGVSLAPSQVAPVLIDALQRVDAQRAREPGSQ